jgi:hypothetical protein
MAPSGHAAHNFPGRKQPKQWYDSSTPPRRAGGSAREKISNLKVKVMAWTSPVFEEVVLCCEINSYVSAQL